MLFVELLQERDAPLAAGSCAEAVRQSTGHWWVLAFHEIAELPQADAKAQADMIVGFHGWRPRVMPGGDQSSLGDELGFFAGA